MILQNLLFLFFISFFQDSKSQLQPPDFPSIYYFNVSIDLYEDQFLQGEMENVWVTDVSFCTKLKKVPYIQSLRVHPDEEGRGCIRIYPNDGCNVGIIVFIHSYEAGVHNNLTFHRNPKKTKGYSFSGCEGGHWRKRESTDDGITEKSNNKEHELLDLETESHNRPIKDHNNIKNLNIFNGSSISVNVNKK